MKRLIAVMLGLCMIFSLADCGEGTSAEAAAADTNTLTLVVDGQELPITLYDIFPLKAEQFFSPHTGC